MHLCQATSQYFPLLDDHWYASSHISSIPHCTLKVRLKWNTVYLSYGVAMKTGSITKNNARLGKLRKLASTKKYLGNYLLVLSHETLLYHIYVELWVAYIRDRLYLVDYSEMMLSNHITFSYVAINNDSKKLSYIPMRVCQGRMCGEIPKQITWGIGSNCNSFSNFCDARSVMHGDCFCCSC